ncbi:protein XRP2-like [Dermacentor variabilis]|uniref:protein XRP2-like n=1 Tax=Dermacentor variabilis TaxID=34621 RepID=UPI003F5BF618
MGAVQRKLMLFSAGSAHAREHDQSKTYSWDTKPRVDAANYTVENAIDTTVTKCPGNVNGQQFVIRNCHNASLYVLDHINSVTIDDCTNCNIVLGPTQGSVFLRNCNNVRLASACQQLRARDCFAIDSWLCCSTQPSIESCSEMRFGCLTLAYEQFPEQLKKAHLSPFNNHWSEVYDFTPTIPEPNWSLLPPEAMPRTLVEACPMPMSLDPQTSHVPLTLGPSCKRNVERCLVVLFWNDNLQENSMAFVRGMKEAQADLVQTLEACLEDGLAQSIFQNGQHGKVAKGSAVALEYTGVDCRQVCQQIAAGLTPGTHYISPQELEMTKKQIEAAFNTTQCTFS